MAKKKSRGQIAPEPRPSYEPMQIELSALVKSLTAILEAGEDEDGELNDVQLAQAGAALKLLSGARTLLECPQLFGPYDPNSKTKARARKKK